MRIISSIKYDTDDISRIAISALVLISCYSVAVFSGLWKYTLVLSGMLLLCQLIIERELPSKIAFCLMILFFVNFLSTLLNGNLTIVLIKLYAAAVVYVLWCDLYCRKYTGIFALSHIVIVGMIIVIQLFFQIYDPDAFGLTKANNMVNFLCSDNMTGYYIVPFMVLVAVCGLRMRSRMTVWAWILIAVSLGSILKSESGTCIIGGCSFACLMIVCLLFRKKFRFPMTVLYIVYLAFLAGILFFSIQNYAADFLLNVLGKSVTFSGRTYIWELVPSYIAKKPLLGYGTMTGNRAEVIWIGSDCEAKWMRSQYWSAHNYFFSILIEGGIVQMLSYIAVIITATRSLMKGKDNMVGNIIKVGIFAMFIMYTAEGELLIPAQYLIFILAFYNDKFARTQGMQTKYGTDPALICERGALREGYKV